MKKILTLALFGAIALGAVTFSSCNKKKGLMTLNATGADISLYEAAFSDDFDVSAVDANEYGFGFSVHPSRYVVNVSDKMSNMMPDGGINPDNQFFICIEDTGGASVQITILYTVGAEDKNPTVVKQNFSGSMTMNNTYNYIFSEEANTNKRAEEIASFIRGILDKAEGKDKK